MPVRSGELRKKAQSRRALPAGAGRRCARKSAAPHAMTFLRYFLYVLGAALLSAVVGGVFASVVALVSPEFVKGLFSPPNDASLPRYAAAVGMIWGVFIGAG